MRGSWTLGESFISALSPSSVAFKSTQAETDCTSSLPNSLLHYGDVLRIRADSRIPSDGIVVAGSGEVDESSATGESLPSPKEIGSSVIAGTLNLNGSLDVQITQLVHENSLARVASLVRQAQSSKSRFQDIADRFSAVILPIAAVVAVSYSSSSPFPISTCH